MLQVNNVSKAYGDTVVLRDVSFTANAGERIGLIGPNGCGKTTLLRIIVGQEQPDRGSVHLSPSGLTVGYLAQALEFEPGATVRGVMGRATARTYDTERELEALAEELAVAQASAVPSLLKRYADALARFEAAGGYQILHQIDAVLAGLGLGAIDQDAPVAILSGGQKTRLGLAQLLLSQPQVLVLDEPTNHLDIEALEWLEGFLVSYHGAVLLVSHDRAILDRLVTTTLELSPVTRTTTAYPGNYSDYSFAKQRELDTQWASYKDQQERINRMERDIQGLSGRATRIERETEHYHYKKIAKGLARRAVVQRRRLERLLQSGERVEKPGQAWRMKLAFEGALPSGKDVLVLENLALGYGRQPLLTDISLSLRQGERIVLVGPNGSGKTTLLRSIVGQVAPLGGHIRLGANVRIGYYDQEQEGLEGDANAFEAIRSVAPLGETEARSFLHYFLFTGDDVFTPVEQLSFGERAQLALAKLVATGCNLLLLDEPINHLDIPSRERFEQGLSVFGGTVLAVVHDRYFIERFATGVWLVEAGTVRCYADLGDLHRSRTVR